MYDLKEILFKNYDTFKLQNNIPNAKWVSRHMYSVILKLNDLRWAFNYATITMAKLTAGKSFNN